jgi:predicted RNA-binding Zn-ribbon protein involved in translation (DUF1610 family)
MRKREKLKAGESDVRCPNCGAARQLHVVDCKAVKLVCPGCGWEALYTLFIEPRALNAN